MSVESSRSHQNAERLRDRNGLTEEEFLAAYVEKDYPKPSLTADICVFRRMSGGLELLLVRRGGHPYLGCWALPGGFVEKGEDADAAAARELAEETGVEGLALEQIGFYSTPGRDPRGWIVSEAYLSVDAEGRSVHAGDDADDAAWFALDVADEPTAETGSNGERHAAADGPDAQHAAASDGDGAPVARTRITLESATGGAKLALSFRAERSAQTGRCRAVDVESQGLAFDHARIIADAYLAAKNL